MTEPQTADAGFSSPLVQLRRLAEQHTTNARPAPVGELPLAPLATVIQRKDDKELTGTFAAATLRGSSATTGSPGMEALLGTAEDAVYSAPSEKLDLDEVVERVMRRLTRSLAVESERHGGRRWPWKN